MIKMVNNTVYPSEFIGEEIEVVDSTNKSLIGLCGKVVDETKNTIIIEIQGKKIILLKSSISIKFRNLLIEGKDIIKRPEERIKGR
jgi:ribonuclease P protein subunit POP4